MKNLLILLFIGSSVFAQDPQTNSPEEFYPILDEYIKEGYERNFRTHTRILDNIKYVYFTDITKIRGTEIVREYPMGSTSTYKVYSEWTNHKRKNVYYIFINDELKNDYYILRRLVFKSLGIIHGLSECKHPDCTHIMTRTVVTNPELAYHDENNYQWEEQLDVLYQELYKKKPLN